jgi:hypothetical protein
MTEPENQVTQPLPLRVQLKLVCSAATYDIFQPSTASTTEIDVERDPSRSTRAPAGAHLWAGQHKTGSSKELNGDLY